MNASACDAPGFVTPDGTSLAVHRWEPEEPMGHVYLLHGFGEHAGRYGELAGVLNAAGWAVHAPDHRGHGLSGGQRAIVPSGTSVAADYLAFLEAEPERSGPQVLLGHSMGGAAAVQVALRASGRFSGLVLSSPFLEPARPPGRLALWGAGVLARLFPRVIVMKLDSDSLSKEQAEAAAYDDDPLVHHGGVSAVSAHSLVQAGLEALSRAGELTLPLFIIHGSRDAVAGVDGSRRLVAAAGSRDRQILEFEDGLHELLNDHERGRVHDAITGWLADRFGTSAAGSQGVPDPSDCLADDAG